MFWLSNSTFDAKLNIYTVLCVHLWIKIVNTNLTVSYISHFEPHRKQKDLLLYSMLVTSKYSAMTQYEDKAVLKVDILIA